MSTTPPTTVTGAQIKAARESLGLTQEQLAALFRTTKTTIYRWEVRGAKPASVGCPGAIWMALEYLKQVKMLDASPLLNTLDARLAELETFRAELHQQAGQLDALR